MRRRAASNEPPVQFENVAWETALQRILFDNHCEYEIEGKTLHVRRMR